MESRVGGFALALLVASSTGCGLILEADSPAPSPNGDVGLRDGGTRRDGSRTDSSTVDGGMDASPRVDGGRDIDARTDATPIDSSSGPDGSVTDSAVPLDAFPYGDGGWWNGRTCYWNTSSGETRGCDDGWECRLSGTTPCHMGGICVMRGPTPECLAGGEVCGCDDVTYADDCARQAGGKPLRHDGACVSP